MDCKSYKPKLYTHALSFVGSLTLGILICDVDLFIVYCLIPFDPCLIKKNCWFFKNFQVRYSGKEKQKTPPTPPLRRSSWNVDTRAPGTTNQTAPNAGGSTDVAAERDNLPGQSLKSWNDGNCHNSLLVSAPLTDSDCQASLAGMMKSKNYIY